MPEPSRGAWSGLDDEENDGPGGDERRHAQAEPLSREGSALRVGEIAQALTLGTARIDAARARVDAVQVRSHRVGRDEQIAVRERNLEQVQPIDDGRTTVQMLPVREPHGSATEGGDGPAIDG